MNNILFLGERLQEAREYRNYTLTELAEKIDVTKQALLQYERGMKPRDEKIKLLIDVLNFPEEFFIQKNDDIKINNTFFRALSTTKKIDLRTQEVKTKNILRFYSFLQEYFDYPEFDIPIIDYSEDMNIEDTTMQVRKHFGLGDEPIENVVSLLEKHGVVISTLDIGNKKIDAFTQVHNINGINQYCIVLSNDKQSRVRRNFDIAHELGHIVLHSNIENIAELSEMELKSIEDQANNFAAAFLLPRESFKKCLTNPSNLEFYKELKRKWKVSIAAMLMRAMQLNLIDRKEYQNLMKYMTYKKWRSREPFDNEWPLQEVYLFRKSIDILINNVFITAQNLIKAFNNAGLFFYGKDIEELLDLEKGTLTNNIIEFKLRDNNSRQSI